MLDQINGWLMNLLDSRVTTNFLLIMLAIGVARGLDRISHLLERIYDLLRFPVSTRLEDET